MEHIERVAGHEEGVKPTEGVRGCAHPDTSGEDKRKGRTLEEILEHHFGDVPQEEWDKLPDDLIDRLDYYTSGADVRQGYPPELPDTPAGRLFDRIRDLFSDVPQEEWDNWPDDLIDNLDHYLYGTDKR